MQNLNDVGAERALLLAIIENNAVLKLIGNLEAEDFSSPELATVFAEMELLVERGVPVTALSLRHVLDQTRMPSGQSAREFIGQNTVGEIVPKPEDVISTIKDLASRREVLTAVRNVREDVLDLTTPVAQTVKALRQRTDGIIADGLIHSGKVTWAEHTATLTDTLTNGASPMHLTGIPALDEHKGGLRPHEFMTIAGATGMGKSAVLHEIKMNFALRGEGVLLISREMPGADVVARCVSSLMYRKGFVLPYEDIMRNRMHLYDAPVVEAFWRAMHEYKNLPIRVVGEQSCDIASIGMHVLEARKYFEERDTKLNLIGVDHLGLITPSRHQRGNSYGHMVELTGTLAGTAREHKIPTIALSQLNREVSKRDRKIPQLSDLRDSGSVEQDSDSVLFAYRPAYYLKKELDSGELTDMDRTDKVADLERLKNNLMLILAKNRGGREGTIHTNIEIGCNRIW